MEKDYRKVTLHMFEPVARVALVRLYPQLRPRTEKELSTSQYAFCMRAEFYGKDLGLLSLSSAVRVNCLRCHVAMKKKPCSDQTIFIAAAKKGKTTISRCIGVNDDFAQPGAQGGVGIVHRTRGVTGNF